MKRVLLADDDDALRSALALLLQTRLGMTVIAEATSMETTLDAAHVEQPDLILLDWELPGEPRFRRIEALRSAAPNARLVVASARPEAATQALADRADAFVNKTDPPEIILAVFGG